MSPAQMMRWEEWVADTAAYYKSKCIKSSSSFHNIFVVLNQTLITKTLTASHKKRYTDA